MPNSNREPHKGKFDPDQLQKMLDIELMQKRASWQQARRRRGKFRALAFFFLFLVIAAALLAFFLFLP